MLNQKESRQIGNSTIEVQDEEFFSGFTAGMLTYRQRKSSVSLTDSGMYDFLLQTLIDVRTMDSYRAGFVSGWYAALYGASVAQGSIGTSPQTQQQEASA